MMCHRSMVGAVLRVTAGVLLLTSIAYCQREEEAFDPNAPPIFEDLPGDYDVIGVGTYAGTKAVKGVQLDDSGHGVRQAEVAVNYPEKPVVLVLTAYDPTVWRVWHTEKTKIAGVVVSGYHGQALIGIEKSVPYKISTHDVKGEFPAFYAYQAGPELKAYVKRTRKLTGKEIIKFVNKPQQDGRFWVGEPIDQEELRFSDDLTLKQFVVKDRPPAGRDGLELLVKEGKIRPAKQEDIEAWVDKASEEYRKLNPDLRVETRMRPERTYVVLKDFEMPKGLFGAHSASFIIPDDAPTPSGDAGHCDFYLMDGTMEDPFTRAEKRARAIRGRAEP